MRLAVLDLDGVLADTRHRLHHLSRGHKDWAAFFAAAEQDPVHPEGRAVLAELLARSMTPVYLSGRPERTRAATRRWLTSQALPDAELLLRPDGDRRPAATVKLEHLRRLGAVGEVAVLVDDDPVVVKAVSAAGTSVAAAVLHATWQPRDDSTDRAQRLGRT